MKPVVRQALGVLLLSSLGMAFFRTLGSSSLNALSGLTSIRRLPLRTCRLAMSTTVNPNSVAAKGSATPLNINVEEEDLFGFDLPTNENSPFLLKTRHTASHIMAMAVQKLHKEAQVTIGPWIDNGFYYDFYIPNQQLSENDLKLIKKEMDKIIKADLPLRREEVSREEAR